MALKYHGKVLTYPNIDARAAFMKALPRRADFIEASPELAANVKSGKPVMFLPNDVREMHYKTDKGLTYHLLLIGIVPDGNKAAVILTGIEPFYEIRVPGDASSRFIQDFKHTLNDRGNIPDRVETYKHYPAKIYQETQATYLRLYFHSTSTRRRSLESCRSDPYVYTTVNGTKNSVILETAADDTASYYRKIGREAKFKLGDWNIVQKYRVARDREYTLESKVPYTFVCDYSDFVDARSTGLDILSDQVKYKDYIRDKTMEMAWDIETAHSDNSMGGAPEPQNVFIFDKRKKPEREDDIIFMDSCVFSWYHDKEPFLTVNITTLPVAKRDDCLIIICKTQMEIICTKALLCGRMCPDIIVAFNDGLYDWPFVNERITQYDRYFPKKDTYLQFVKRQMSVVPLNDDTDKWTIKGPRAENIKLEANTTVSNEFFDAPGYICIDARTIFRKLYPRSEQSSLNFFLSVNKLGQKEDMPYQMMWKIQRVADVLCKQLAVTEYKCLINAINSLIAKHGECANYSQLLYPSIFDTQQLHVTYPFPRIDTSAFRLHEATLGDLLRLINKMADVVHYCNVDAKLVHDLLRIRNVIADRREIANLSYTSVFDAVYRAGGMKMRNLIIAEGVENQWNLAFTNASEKRGNFVQKRTEKKSKKDEKKKYPGAYVVPPKKGMYNSHSAIKRRRRESYITANALPHEFTYEEVKPGSPGVTELYNLTDQEFDNKYPITEKEQKNVDQNGVTDLPCSGLDFQSLYPSLMMAYNISSETVVLDPGIYAYLQGRTNPCTGKPYKFLYVEFRYGYKSMPEEEKELITGWIIQHEPVEAPDSKPGRRKFTRYDGMGIYPYILKKLFDFRAQVKKRMEYYGGPREIMADIFKKHKPAIISAMAPEQQKQFMREQLETALTARKDTFAQTKKGFHGWQVKALEEIIETIKVEYLNRDGITFLEFYDDCVFYYNYFNSKQMALKEFMNTAYGETGNQNSPFFIVLVAGAITTNGQKNIKMVKSLVENKGCDVKYGDTDSLYTCPPMAEFAHIIDQYIKNNTNIEQYWTMMIEFTMEYMDKLKAEVNEFLYQDNGTDFLKMAYEEVLYPYIFLGKKKYVGVQHQGVVNLSICHIECGLGEFINSKSLFLRGLELTKRGSSELLKTACYEIIKEALALGNTKTLIEIVKDKVSSIATRQFPLESFVRSAAYKLPGIKPDTGERKQGNVTVLKFVDRMRELEKLAPYLGIRAPDVGERFRYVLVRVFPWSYDMRGCKSNIAVGDKYEYVESVNNSQYREYRKSEIEVDIDYYITNELIGQFARFLTYHPDYDKFYDSNQNEYLDDYEADCLYKKLDKKARDFGKQQLTAFYKQNFERTYKDTGKVYKRIFKEINSTMAEITNDIYGPSACVLQAVCTAITKKQKKAEEKKGMRSAIREALIHRATAVSNRARASTVIVQLVKKSGLNPYRARKIITQGNQSILAIREKVYNALYIDTLKKLDSLLPDFEKICKQYSRIVGDVVFAYRYDLESSTNIAEIDSEIMNIDLREHFDMMIESFEAINYDDEPERIINAVYNVYTNLISVLALKHENVRTKEQLDLYVANKKGFARPPVALRQESMNVQFSKWLSQQLPFDD